MTPTYTIVIKAGTPIRSDNGSQTTFPRDLTVAGAGLHTERYFYLLNGRTYSVPSSGVEAAPTTPSDHADDEICKAEALS